MYDIQRGKEGKDTRLAFASRVLQAASRFSREHDARVVINPSSRSQVSRTGEPAPRLASYPPPSPTPSPGSRAGL
jgi:hypothetical protein